MTRQNSSASLNGPRANPLAAGPLTTRDDIQRAVSDLYDPLRAHTSPNGANVRLGSFSSAFADRVAELEGFARPLYGIVPLAVGGGGFPHWDRIVAGIDAGTDPSSDEYWGPVASSPDQRMVEQAAIGLALAFCPEHTWEQLGARARDRLVQWLHGIYEHEPVQNNWQFFRVLVSLGLERVGAPVDQSKTDASLDLIDSYARGDHWYVDGRLANVDYYVPWAFHTYGLMYVAANRLGLGSDSRAAAFAERAAGFASDFVHWFGPDGSAIPYGRSLTYRFAMGSMWGALAWADVESDVPWSVVKGLSMRNLRWWADKPISDRDGVLSVGYAYDNRRLAESYNSAGSPYWCMKYFSGLAAPADHAFWTSDEAEQPPLDGPVTLGDAGWIVDRDDAQAVALIARQAPPLKFMEQMAAKYDKFAYSSTFGFSGDCEGSFGGPVTDSTLALIDDEGNRQVLAGARLAGVEDGMAWSVWFPFKDVRVNTVLTGGAPWHLRLHMIETERTLTAEETGFAVANSVVSRLAPAPTEQNDVGAVIRNASGVSAIFDIGGARSTHVMSLPANANIMHGHTAAPMLRTELDPGRHRITAAVLASPDTTFDATVLPAVSDAASLLLDEIASLDASPWPSRGELVRQVLSPKSNPETKPESNKDDS